jgi:hypothetical protein
MGRVALTLLFGSTLAIAAIACADSDGADRAANIRAAKQFERFPLYWLGHAAAGLPLASIESPNDYDPESGFAVIYGDCEIEPGDESCTAPLEVNTTTEAAPPLSAYAGEGAPERRTMRGVPTIIYQEGKSAELFTGRARVGVYADSPARLAQAIRLLRPINDRGRQSAKLPPPKLRVPGQ